ncbi:MAG: site-specific DNA-methyltransferase [Candidatus Nitrosotenuis sp.]
MKKRKKYGIVWEDKPEQVVDFCKHKLPVLKEIKSKEIVTSKNEPCNFLIEGDNYHALSVLYYTHKGKIDVIYIDPPYNTGARDWTYNNNYVDSEDPYRHTKWLSFMNNRLRIARKLLSNNGIICCTIDDYELPRLWMLMDEIFSEKNHLGTIVIRINPGGRKSKREVATQHEYALFFSRSSSAKVAQIPKPPEEKTHSYKKDDLGWYEERNLRKEGADSLAKEDSERFYPIYYDPKTGKFSTKTKYEVEILPLDSSSEKRIWRRDRNVIDEMSDKGDLLFKKTKFGPQVYFKFRGGLEGETPKSFWDDKKYSASEHGTQILDKILGRRETFSFPKSPHAVADCIKVASDKKNAIILDFFAGSGTTAQAVLELNKQDGGNRRFILCTNNENNIATEICYPRIKRIIEGYTQNTDKILGLGGNLKYFKTDFVDGEPTDTNKKKLVEQSTEMLCLKEDCFDLVVAGDQFKIFKNPQDQYLGIIYYYNGIEPFKNQILKLNKKINTYVFSLSGVVDEEEFDDVEHLVNLKPIPIPILNAYRGILAYVQAKKIPGEIHQ